MSEKIEARTIVDQAAAELGVSLADLIALSSIWVAPEVFRILSPVSGVWYPDRRRANLGLRVQGKQIEFVGQVIDGVTLDSNSYPNVAFKQALGFERQDFVGFHVCHVWPGTAYDIKCFANIANLVAIPAELSSLSDHHSDIVACLKFRSWELYGWKPEKEKAPAKPDRYPSRWRDPWPANDAALKLARKRVRSRAEVPLAAERIPIKEKYLSSNDATEAAIVAAFYLSRFEHDRLELGNQGQTIDRIARALGIPRNTLKNYRDYFDSHTGSHREGWKVPLPPSLADPFPALMRMDEAGLRARVLSFVRK
jgi:hypothetical protein